MQNDWNLLLHLLQRIYRSFACGTNFPPSCLLRRQFVATIYITILGSLKSQKTFAWCVMGEKIWRDRVIRDKIWRDAITQWERLLLHNFERQGFWEKSLCLFAQRLCILNDFYYEREKKLRKISFKSWLNDLSHASGHDLFLRKN